MLASYFSLNSIEIGEELCQFWGDRAGDGESFVRQSCVSDICGPGVLAEVGTDGVEKFERSFDKVHYQNWVGIPLLPDQVSFFKRQ